MTTLCCPPPPPPPPLAWGAANVEVDAAAALWPLSAVRAAPAVGAGGGVGAMITGLGERGPPPLVMLPQEEICGGEKDQSLLYRLQMSRVSGVRKKRF